MNAKHVRNADPGHPVPADVIAILETVVEERDRAMAKWGIQNHPDGTGGEAACILRDAARDATDEAAKKGVLTWKQILMEEVREAFAETDLVALDKELEQVMQVACVWREHLRRRMALAAAGRFTAQLSPEHDARVQEALKQALKQALPGAPIAGAYAAHVERFGDPRRG